MVAPLIALVKKYAFFWTSEEAQDFEKLKEATCRNPILATADFTKNFTKECDASWHGIGLVLMQEGRTLAFESHQLKVKKLNLFMRRKCWPYYIQLSNGIIS